MKYLVFTALFFLIIHQDLYCQSCDRLSLKVEKLYSKGEYVKAIKISKANLKNYRQRQTFDTFISYFH